MNPGKIIDPPPMTQSLRFGPSYRTIKIDTYFDFSKPRRFAGAIEMCNGVGACRKTLTGTMCPSFVGTREEEHSTRGRANALRAVISGSLARENFKSARLHEVLDLCLECKACKAECPSNVDMAKIKYESLPTTTRNTDYRSETVFLGILPDSASLDRSLPQCRIGS